MPSFDPSAYLAQKQAPQPSPNSGQNATAGQFDLNSYLQSKGISTSDSNNPSDISTVEAIGRGLAQGATSGFGDELSAAAGALVPTATDEAIGRGYTDRYANIRDSIRSDNAAAQAAHPYTYALSEIAGNIPLTVAGGAALKSAGALEGLSNTRAGANIAGAQAALYGLGKSNKDSIPQAALDTAISGIAGYAIAGGLGQLGKAMSDSAKEAGVDLNDAYGEFGDIISAQKPPTVSKVGDGILKVNYGLKPSDSFQLGKDMQLNLADPVAKDMIRTELDQQPQAIQSIIDKTRSTIGDKYDQLVSQYADKPIDLSDAFDSARKKASDVYSESDISVDKSKQALLKLIDDTESQLVKEHGSLDSVPLDKAAGLKEDMGNLIFQQKAFNKSGTSAVNGAAKSFWGGLVDAISENDPTSGQLSGIDKTFKGLYGMEENLPTGSNLLSLANPKAARTNFDNFLASWAQVPMEQRALYGSSIDSYLQGPLAKSIAKGQLMQAVDAAGPISLKSLAVINPLNKSGQLNIANRVGALMPLNNPIPSAVPGGFSKIQQLAAPTTGALIGTNGNN